MRVASPVADPTSCLAMTLKTSRRFSSCLIFATVCASACSEFDRVYFSVMNRRMHAEPQTTRIAL